ncbi:DUF2550 domain-containing protein [Corynebacterium pseudopelargi]|uniref:DUF2550 domain-containing protein n=1 Tax=Corynebacterium pseudopelargi TaxID=2080757 RepID=A0A3G6IUM0_9CORY|nr:DUF2550 domain-containing protein [Corynebacterium pseudopelargi]AZA09465.1 hypothetical protein CPPEL_06770 [Corynebacterium pseudopelargi]
MAFLLFSLVAVFAVFAMLIAWRFITLRSRGTSVTLRRMPAQGVHGWRHGLFRYSGSSLQYYKLRSVLPFANVTFQRKDVALIGHRSLTEHEAEFLSPAQHILTVRFSSKEYELALEPRAEMAFTAWIEAAPDARMERIDVKALRRKMSTNRPSV